MFLWETDTARPGQVSCMLDLCASDCVHESGGMHGVDPLCALQPGDRWDASVSSGLGRALMKKMLAERGLRRLRLVNALQCHALKW